MEDNAQNNKLDDFILNQLNPKERSDFMDQLKSDASLQDELRLRETMVDQVRTIGNLRLKDRILAIQAEVEHKEEKKGIVRFIKPMMAAAAILLLVVVAYQWMNSSNVLTNQELFAQNYQAYNLPFGDRSSGTNNRINEAGALFKQEKYTEVIPLFKELMKDEKIDERVSLGLAISYIELKEYEQAISILKQTSVQNNYLYKDQAQWYMALVHLHLDQIKQSKALLRLIKDNPNAHFKKQAEKLLNDLAKIKE